MKSIQAYSRKVVENQEVKGDALISITSSYNEPLDETFDMLYSGNVLRLSFDDIASDTFERFIGPTVHDIIKIFDHVSEWDKKLGYYDLVIHCTQGISRSTAVMLGVMCHWHKPLPLDRIVDMFLELRYPYRTSPNPLMLGYIESHLGTNGQVDQLLEQRCSEYYTWKKYWKNQLNNN